MRHEFAEAGESWSSFIGMGEMTQFRSVVDNSRIPRRCADSEGLLKIAT